MDETDRATITSNLVQLIEQSNLDALLTELLRKNVFTPAMAEKYRDNTKPAHQLKRELFLDLQTRGPRAFRNLIESLLDTGHLDLVRLLKPDLNIEEYFIQRGDVHPQNPPPPLERGTDRDGWYSRMINGNNRVRSVVSLGKTPFKVNVKLATERMDLKAHAALQAYPMMSRPRGYVLIINNIEYINNIKEPRIGAEVDEQNFKDLFEQLGFIVECHRNQGYQDMRRKICQFADRQEHRCYDCVVVAIMSHGSALSNNQDSTVYSVDGHPLRVEWIVDQFSLHNAQHLARIPKIFFFQTCRGNDTDFGLKIDYNRTRFDGSSAVVVQTMSDTLIGYSTLPGYKSNRDTYLGSWYIQTVCEVFMNHAHEMDIEDMLKIVNQKIELLQTEKGTLQTSSYENRGFRKLFFNPGIYNDTTESTSQGSEQPSR